MSNDASNKPVLEMVMNGKTYQWADHSPLFILDRKTRGFLKMIHDKGIELHYGTGKLPVSVSYPHPFPKLHPKSMEKLGTIHRVQYFNFIDNL